jgi:hypothetical protein
MRPKSMNDWNLMLQGPGELCPKEDTLGPAKIQYNDSSMAELRLCTGTTPLWKMRAIAAIS